MIETKSASKFDSALLKSFGHANVSELTSYEKQQAYELLKRGLSKSLTPKEYQSEIQRITDYLEI